MEAKTGLLTASTSSVVNDDQTASKLITNTAVSNHLDGTFHRRELKPPSIAFSSVQGKSIFKEALQEGNMEGYFYLSEHFMTQGHPAYCGVGSLTMALNSLLIDPKRTWQGVWRWFDEKMLDCCSPHDIMQLRGITMAKLACLARCNGARSSLKYGNSVSVDEFRRDIIQVSSLQMKQQCEPPAGIVDSDTSSSSSSRDDERCVMIASYSRRVLNQTGDGHFSPIGGYCAAQDLVLILDVARFKHPPHWVPLPILYEAMQRPDPDAGGKSRGYLLVCGSSDALCRSCEHCSTTVDSTGSTSSSHDYTGSESESVGAAAASHSLHKLLDHECTHCTPPLPPPPPADSSTAGNSSFTNGTTCSTNTRSGEKCCDTTVVS